MRAILSDIRAHVGVTGVAVLAKRDGAIEHLFPAAFTERHTERLIKLFTETYQRLRGFTRLTLRFERVSVHLFNQPEYLLFATVLPDSDEQQFEMVARSKFHAIALAVANSRSKSATSARGTTGEASYGRPDPVALLINALNAMSAKMIRTRGMVRLAADWRRARDIVATVHEPLTALAVDATGRFEIRKGRQMAPTAATVEAIARLAEQFFEEVGTDRPEAEEIFYSAVERHREALEPYGLFLFLGNNARKPAR
ncbi:MAG TPA: hypothetical protein VGB22_00575 [candidate division Zixibacteria bacterium]|jgi:hypothetical protein